MTYQFKDKEWVGYCDVCKMPYKPNVVFSSITIGDSIRRKYIDIDFKKSRRKFRGSCRGCVNKFDALRTLTRYGFKFRKVGGIKVY